MLYHVARHRGGSADAAAVRKRKALERTVRKALLIEDERPLPPLDLHFQPLSFNVLGAPFQYTVHVIKDQAKLMALRNLCIIETAKSRIQQCIRFAVCPSVVGAILFRMKGGCAAPISGANCRTISIKHTLL